MDGHHRTWTDDEVGGTLYRLRFPALAVLVFTLVAAHAAHGHWIGDFWEHSAVVRELATHPLHPRHPLLVIDAPHALANPYAMLVALFCRLTGASAVAGLATASIVNLVMLLVALRLFVRRVAPAQADAVAFYLLLFMLLLWGREPWDYSGFYHVNVIVHSLPYPSAFAFWVSLLLLALNEKRIADGEPRLLLVTVPMSALVLLAHPPTFLFVAAGLVAMTVDAPRRLTEALVALSALAVAVAAALAWPYFPLWTLLTGPSEPHRRNAVMYSEPLMRTFPALLGIPPLLLSARRTGRWKVVAWMGILFVIYVFGFVTEKYAYGRVVFFMVFLLQLELARFLAQREASTDAGGVRNSWKMWTGAAVAICVLLSTRSLVKTARDLRYPSTYADYTFLRREVGQYDVMMTDRRIGWIAASFGGKLVSEENPVALVSEREHETRRSDAKAFFNAATTQRERKELLRKYGVSFVLVPRSAGADSAMVSDSLLRALGRVTHADDHFLLVRVDSSVRP
jgi:hypothetical protein